MMTPSRLVLYVAMDTIEYILLVTGLVVAGRVAMMVY